MHDDERMVCPGRNPDEYSGPPEPEDQEPDDDGNDQDPSDEHPRDDGYEM